MYTLWIRWNHVGYYTEEGRYDTYSEAEKDYEELCKEHFAEIAGVKIVASNRKDYEEEN